MVKLQVLRRFAKVFGGSKLSSALRSWPQRRHHLCACVKVAESCLTLWNPMNSSPPGSSVFGISQARILECVANPFSRGSSRPRDWTWVSCIAGRVFTVWATREAKVVFLEFPWFLYDPANVGNLISGSSASLKPSLCIWKFLVHVLLKLA